MEPRSLKPLWDPDIINNCTILVAIITTRLFRQNKFNIYFNYHSDADECLNNSHNCSENATCTNTEGSFNCSCKPGYIGNGHNCSGWLVGISVSLSVSFETFGSVQLGSTFTGELIVFVECVREKLNHEIIQNSDAYTV